MDSKPVMKHNSLRTHRPTLAIHQRLLLLLILFYLSLAEHVHVEALSSEELCMRKVCSGCIAGSLSCQEGGLTRLPDQLSPDIQSMILIGHRFDQSQLTKGNFSTYPQQMTQLQRLTLRNCAIERLEPGALESIRSLTQLDLSQNRLRVIEPFTFAGLRLELLRLDENHGLRLAPGAFRDTTIVSLSMNQCGLRSLTYEDLLPLLANNALANLHLSSNNLVTLESQLEPIFLRLQSLSIEQNPFVCDCELQWLTDVLQRRALRRATRALQSADLEAERLNQNTPLDGDLLRPMCQSPERLSGRFVERLNPRDFYCQPPRIEALEVDLNHHEGSQTESVEQESNRMKAIVRCRVKGSPELKLVWFRRPINDFAPMSPLPLSRMIHPGVVQIELEQNSRDTLASIGTNSEVSNRLIEHDTSMERLVCHASDLSGNTSTEVRLQWPRLLTRSKQTDQDVVISPTQYPRAEPVSKTKVQPGSRSDSHSDWFLLTGDDPNRYWTQKQFSALEMILAVVGTFASTLALFILGQCVFKAHCYGHGCSRMKTPLIHSSPEYAHGSPNGKYAAPPPSYSSAPTHSASSGAYPPCTDQSLTEVQAPFMNPRSCYPASIQHTLDGRTGSEGNRMNRIPNMATYEQVPTGLDLYAAAAAYSDSQTYDTPQSASSQTMAQPPNVPLPPIPAVANTALLSPGDNGLSAQNASTLLLYTMPTASREAPLPWSQHTAPQSPHLINATTDAHNRAALTKTLSRMQPGMDQLTMSRPTQFIHSNGSIGPTHQLLVTSNPSHNHQMFNWTNQPS